MAAVTRPAQLVTTTGDEDWVVVGTDLTPTDAALETKTQDAGLGSIADAATFAQAAAAKPIDPTTVSVSASAPALPRPISIISENIHPNQSHYGHRYQVRLIFDAPDTAKLFRDMSKETFAELSVTHTGQMLTICSKAVGRRGRALPKINSNANILQKLATLCRDQAITKLPMDQRI